MQDGSSCSVITTELLYQDILFSIILAFVRKFEWLCHPESSSNIYTRQRHKTKPTITKIFHNLQHFTVRYALAEYGNIFSWFWHLECETTWNTLPLSIHTANDSGLPISFRFTSLSLGQTNKGTLIWVNEYKTHTIGNVITGIQNTTQLCTFYRLYMYVSDSNDFRCFPPSVLTAPACTVTGCLLIPIADLGC